jgi:1-acyl-sn-glycerol-3-phosphate acyltransferase
MGMTYISVSYLMFSFIGALRFLLLGIRVKHVKHSIYDFFPNYQNSKPGIGTGVVICNHSSFLDVFVLFKRKIAFLSKAGIAKAPIFGQIAVERQCIFVNRDDSKNKTAVLDKLKRRADLASEGKIHPVCVFPEGTVSNGRSLMKFKKGAFMTDKPIKIMALKYGNDSNFSTSMANINLLACIAFTLSQPTMNLELHELDEDFDPSFSFTRRGLSEDYENGWNHIADDTKSVISFMTGY